MNKEYKIVVIDGQGGRIGSLLVDKLKKCNLPCSIFAIGTNNTAAAAMLKAGALYGASGENPVIVNARDADFIVGPLGIMAADSLLGEITPAMSVAIGQSTALKILLPVNKCSTYVVGTQDMPVSSLIEQAVEKIAGFIEKNSSVPKTVNTD